MIKLTAAQAKKLGIVGHAPRVKMPKASTPTIWWIEHGVPVPPVKEHRFHPKRMWRFDFAWPGAKIACECEGGVFAGGRHARGAGYRNDIEKYNEATRMGWRVFRFLPEQFTSGQAQNFMKGILLAAIEHG
jgi:hypothetical protein